MIRSHGVGQGQISNNVFSTKFIFSQTVYLIRTHKDEGTGQHFV